MGPIGNKGRNGAFLFEEKKRKNKPAHELLLYAVISTVSCVLAAV
jgi:hypothetical protein